MGITVKEMRESVGMTQKDFAKMFNIPVSTLRKWEQGESVPTPYVVSMMARLLPKQELYTEVIRTPDGCEYYYDISANSLTDSVGNTILIHTSLEGVKKENLPLYVKDLFDSFNEIRNKFERDCEFDKNEDIIWS